MLSLYGNLESGNVYKVRRLSAQLGIAHRRVDVAAKHLLFLITLVACSGSCSPTPPPPPPTLQGTPVTIGDAWAYLVQLRCPNGSDPTNCNAGSAVKQLTTDLVFYSKRDWPGAYDGIISDSTLLANGAVLSPFYVGVYGHPFTPPSDGGDVYGVENGNATALKTRDGSLTRDLYFTGYSCGATGWLLFPPTLATGAWNGQIAMIGQAAKATTCNPTNLSPAYTQYRLVENLTMPFMFHGSKTTLRVRVIISEHYNGSSIASAKMLERFYFAEGWGKVKYERWDKNGTPSRDLTGECPSTAPWDSAPAFAGAVMTDCRTWTNIINGEPGTWAYSSYGWTWP